MLGGIDLVVIGVYFAAVLGLGAWFTRGSRTESGFLFGDGRLPWLAIGVSLVATSVSATTVLGLPAESFSGDLRLLQLSVGSILALPVLWWFIVPRLRGSGATSAYQLLEVTFDSNVRRAAAILYSAHLLLRTGILVYGPALVVERLTGWPLSLCMALMTATAAASTWGGGMRAVTWIDVMQFLTFVTAALVVLGVALGLSGSIEALVAPLVGSGKLTVFDLRIDPSVDRTLISAGLAYAILEIALRGCDQQFVQRYLSTRDVRAANLSSLASILIGVFISMLFFAVGLALWSLVQQGLWNPGTASQDPNRVLPEFISTSLPVGFRGLLVAAILAAAMSSLSSAWTALAHTTVHDIFPDKNRDGSSRRARLWTLLWSGATLGAAMVAWASEGSLLQRALVFTSLFTGPLLGMFLLAFLRPRSRPAAVLAGAISGALAVLAVADPLGWTGLSGTLSWPWNPALGATVTVAIGLVGGRRPEADGSGQRSNTSTRSISP